MEEKALKQYKNEQNISGDFWTLVENAPVHSTQMGYKKYFPRSSLILYLTSLGHQFSYKIINDDRGKLTY